MSDLPEPRHFALAVTQLGARLPVVASTAIFSASGLKIIDKGATVDARIYERLTQHQLAAPLDQCVETEPRVSGPALREAIATLCRGEPFFAAMLQQPPLRDAFLDELELVPLPPAVAFQLTLMRETQPELWLHALRSAVTAAWLGTRESGTRFDLRQLAAAGLLHDLGMLHLDPQLLQPELGLGREQRRQLYTHSLVTVLLLERHQGYTKELLRAVREHHEAMDGSGYPQRLMGAQLSPWGRVLGLTEVVTALSLPDRPARARRLSLVLRMNRHLFDARLVAEVTRLLPLLGNRDAPPVPADPAGALVAIDALLGRWTLAVQEAGTAVGPRTSAVERVQDICSQARRALSSAGASPVQLAQLGDPLSDEALHTELGLIAQEAAWQLRSATRHARRHWQLAAGQTYPPSVDAWLAEAEAQCALVFAG